MPNLVGIFENFYGEEEWFRETNDIAQELCYLCGTLPEFLPFIEEQLSISGKKNYKLILKEFLDNLHTPFLLQIGAPIFIFLLELEGDYRELKIQSIDALGDFGDLEDVGRYVLSNSDSEIQVLGLRALEKIAKHYKKRGKIFNWMEYLDYLISDNLEVCAKVIEDLDKPDFLKESTALIIKPIIEHIHNKLIEEEEIESNSSK
jgi:hypothetical protein